MSVPRRFFGLLMTVSAMMVAVSSVAGEVERFRSLERDALREAERRLPQMFDRDTGQVLVTPSNDAERYVIARERRWYSQMQEQSRLKANDDGVMILEHSPASMATTWLVVDEDGTASFRCDLGHHDRYRRFGSQAAAETLVR